MFEKIRRDFSRYKINTRQSIFMQLLHIVGIYGFHATIVYRFGHWISENLTSAVYIPIKYPLLLLYWLINSCVIKCYDIRISSQAKIGTGLYIGHFGGIEIGKCVIGRNCSIQQQTKINSNGQNNNMPTVGSNVWIGAHSIINNNVLIDDDATVAAGSVVKNNISTHCLVAGNPARIIKQYYDNTEILRIVL